MRIVWAAFAALEVGSTGSAHWGWAAFFALLCVRPYAPKEDS